MVTTKEKQWTWARARKLVIDEGAYFRKLVRLLL